LTTSRQEIDAQHDFMQTCNHVSMLTGQQVFMMPALLARKLHKASSWMANEFLRRLVKNLPDLLAHY
jgi:hypothetical protein